MKRMPLILSGVFLAITLARVAQFVSDQMSAGVLGWLFAVGLGAAVYTASYWTRSATTRKQARIALVLFVAVDAYINFADVWMGANVENPLVAVGAVLYGLFPTVAVAALAYLAGAIQKLPPDGAARRNNALIDALYKRALRKLRVPDVEPTQATTAAANESAAQPVEPVAPTEATNASAQPTAQPTKATRSKKYTCAQCGVGYDVQQSLASHLGAHARKKAKEEARRAE